METMTLKGKKYDKNLSSVIRAYGY